MLRGWGKRCTSESASLPTNAPALQPASVAAGGRKQCQRATKSQLSSTLKRLLGCFVNASDKEVQDSKRNLLYV